MRHRLTGLLFIVIGGLMVALCLFMVFDVLAQQLDADQDQAAIQQLLQKQTEAWNRGDLEDFMTGYDRSSDLTFFSGGGTHQGWDATLKRYRDRYQVTGKSMGALSFGDLRIDRPGPDLAWVRGSYQLSDGPKTDHGLFTLVLRKSPAGWRIVHDHTSQ